MVNRPGSFDITTPTGASSPRSGDDELRKIKEYVQNAYRDLTEPEGASNQHTVLYGTDVHSSGNFMGDHIGNTTGDLTGNSTGVHHGAVGIDADQHDTISGTLITATAVGITGGKGFVGNLEGNADTATTWETERTITVDGDVSGSIAIDGSEDETLTVTVDSVQPNSVDLGTDTVGSYVEQISGTANEVEVSTNNTEGSNVTIGLPATINADTTGNAATTTALETARTIGLTGDVNGSMMFDGTGDISISTTIQPNSVELGADTTGNFVREINGTANEIEVSHNAGEGSTATLSLPSTINASTTGNAATATELQNSRNIGGVAFNGSSSINLPGVNTEGNQDTTGNANTATTLETSRTIGGVSFDGSANINLPGVNTAGTQNTSGNAATASAWATERTITLQVAPGSSTGATGSATIDGSGNIIINTQLTGAAEPGSTVASANTLTNERQIALTGDVTGSVNFDGSQNVSISTTIADDAVQVNDIDTSNAASASTYLRGDGSWDTPTNTVYTHPTFAGDDINIDTGALTGATVISDLDFNISTNTQGHVTDANATVATRNLTLANLGYTGASNANHYTHPTYAGDDAAVDTGALTGATVISDLDFNINTDGTGHVTDANATVSTRNLTLANLGYTGATNANRYVHPTYNGDDASVDTGVLSGATVISDLDFNITTDTSGHVTDANATVATRNLTLANLGYTGATNANNYVHPTQSAIDTNTSGSTIIDRVQVNTAGHVTNVATRTLTLANLGYTGATNANNYTLPTNQRFGNVDVYTGNSNDYLFYDASHGLRFYTAGDEEMRLTDGGDLHVEGNVIGYSTTVSDERMKKDIKPIENSLEILDGIGGYTFTYLQDDKASAGVIAQEVQKVLPSAVKETELPLQGTNEKRLTVEYDQIIGVLVASVKELKARIEELENGSSE